MSERERSGRRMAAKSVGLFDRAREHFVRDPAGWETHCASLAAALDELESISPHARPGLPQIAACLGNTIAVMTEGLEDPQNECGRALYRVLASLVDAAGGVSRVDEAIAAAMARRYIAQAAAKGDSE